MSSMWKMFDIIKILLSDWAVISDGCLISIICSIPPFDLKCCFLHVHNMYVFGNMHSVPKLFNVFVCTEYFAMGKSRRCYSKISSFCHYSRNRECHCVASHRILSAYFQINIFEFHLHRLNRTNTRSADFGKVFLWPPCISVLSLTLLFLLQKQ